MKNLLLLLIVLLTTSCATFTVSTLNHDPIYDDENYYVVGDNLKTSHVSSYTSNGRCAVDREFVDIIGTLGGFGENLGDPRVTRGG